MTQAFEPVADASEVLALDPPAGLREFRSRRASEEICRSIEAQGIRCLLLDLRGVSDKAGLLAAWAESIGAPGRVGRNWDAMDEAMRDLGWARAERYVVIVTGAGELASTDATAWQTALDILRMAVNEWQTRGIPMLVLVRGVRLPNDAASD
ncbi:MAG: barstar family protein [Chloroflexi bacterium]|nr:barstar family protein [Chloroflexota bacterium]